MATYVDGTPVAKGVKTGEDMWKTVLSAEEKDPNNPLETMHSVAKNTGGGNNSTNFLGDIFGKLLDIGLGALTGGASTFIKGLIK
jgi:hypothetical protein